MKKIIQCVVVGLVIPSFIFAGNESGKTYYHQNDGGVTVVERSTDHQGAGHLHVRKYDSEAGAYVSENKAEIALAVAAIGIAIYQDWSERKNQEALQKQIEEDALRKQREELALQKQREVQEMEIQAERRRQESEQARQQPETKQSIYYYYVTVASVNQNSIAQTAGIQVGDYILEYDGASLVRTTPQGNPLMDTIQSRADKRSQQVQVIIFRNGQAYTTTVPAGELLGITCNSIYLEASQ